MFELFKAGHGKDELTSLDLRPATPPATHLADQPKGQSAPGTTAQPPAAQSAASTACVQMSIGLEGAHVHLTGAHRKFQQFTKTGLKPELLFYLVFPQQGHSYSLTTGDGSRTVLPIFNSKPMADAYIAARKIGAVAAACRLESLTTQADHWIASGINYYAMNACSRCFNLVMYPISELQTEDSFLNNWRLDLANRRQFAEVYGRNASNVVGSNPKQARIWFEGIRDHIDPANPYLHWMIAVLAGVSGDMEANAASIRQLEMFGPAFAGKLKGTSFDPRDAGSQISTMPEAMIGLGVALGYIDPDKLQT